MKVILTETIETLGIIGSEVTVADGYGRNYLLPQKKAVLATEANRKQLAQEKKRFELQIQKEKALAEEAAKRIEGVSCTISAKVSDGNKLYGSINVRDIINALAKEGLEIQKRMLLLAAPIKELGEHKVPVRVYQDIEPEIIVNVISEGGEDQAPAPETMEVRAAEPEEVPEAPEAPEEAEEAKEE